MDFNAGQHLPGELIDIIVKYLLPDRRAVGLCSLICKAWVPWTRLYLFSYVRLVSYKGHVVPFLLLLQSPRCTFPPYVRRLHIDWHQVADLPFEQRGIVLDVLRSKHPWLDYKDDFKASIFHKIKTSVAKTVDLSPSSHVMNIVRLFPAVEHLQIQLWAFYPKVAECHGLPPVSPTLKSLSLICNILVPPGSALPREWRNLLNWIHRERIYNINKLYFGAMSSWNARGAEALLKVQGGSVRHLLVSPLLSTFLHPPIHVTHSPCLESLHYAMGRKGLSRVVADMFSTLSTNHIATVGFDTKEGLLRDHVEVQHMQRLDTILASHTFPKLSRILVRLDYIPDSKFSLYDSSNIIYHAFRLGRARGIVEVEQLPYERRALIWDLFDDCFGRFPTSE